MGEGLVQAQVVRVAHPLDDQGHDGELLEGLVFGKQYPAERGEGSGFDIDREYEAALALYRDAGATPAS